jgi:hypothetical protein
MYIGVVQYTASELLLIYALDVCKPNNIKDLQTTTYTKQQKRHRLSVPSDSIGGGEAPLLKTLSISSK